MRNFGIALGIQKLLPYAPNNGVDKLVKLLLCRKPRRRFLGVI